MSASIHLQRAYERAPAFEQLAPESRLRYLEWKIVFELDGLRTGADVALAFGLAEERAEEIFERLIQRGLIAENEIGLSEYLQRAKPPEKQSPAPSAEDRTRSVPAAEAFVASPPPKFETQAAPSSHRASAPANGHNGASAHAASGGPDAISFSLKKRFRLKSVLDFIQGHAGGGTLGQLAVYRTFMLIPSALLRESGLQRLDFHNDTVEIDSPKLRKAIVDAVSKTLRVEIPVAYFLE